jgi:hypothetical protein
MSCARCGRCGLWNNYPKDYHEQKWEGVCLWYQIRLRTEDVWEARLCEDFIEKIPGITPMEHLDYKIKRDQLGDSYKAARRGKYISYISLALSLIGISLALYRATRG